jgi:acetyl-CoA carboxylase, biotin carboxylase subunit
LTALSVRRLAVANRGEIAVRVIRACRDLGLESVLLCAEVDLGSLAARLADRVVVIEGKGPRESYLDVEAVVEAAVCAEADALHPGYGFMSENAALARRCHRAGLVFVGPLPEHIEILGDKNRAREAMVAHGVPVVPGTREALASVEEAVAAASTIGYPLLLKASKGGGGRGMRKVTCERDLPAAFESARSEAQTAFGSPEVYLERYIEKPRHIEVQIAADCHGNAVYLFERECSVQRRFQKMIEEAPSSFVDEATRRRMGEAAVAGARGIGYQNLGTFEFLMDENRNFYFLEVNTRIQVEHPVTEAVTGVDLVALQIALACGAPLPFRQEDLSIQGWAFEARITCENAERDFVPDPGALHIFEAPAGPGVRFDSMGFEGYTVPPFFDSLLAKLIVHGATREEARLRMLRALREMRVGGVSTSIGFHVWAFENRAFAQGDLSTHFIEEHGWAAQAQRTTAGGHKSRDGALVAALVALGLHVERLHARPTQVPLGIAVGDPSAAQAQLTGAAAARDAERWQWAGRLR